MNRKFIAILIVALLIAIVFLYTHTNYFSLKTFSSKSKK